jgi:hypothetical protein
VVLHLALALSALEQNYEKESIMKVSNMAVPKTGIMDHFSV